MKKICVILLGILCLLAGGCSKKSFWEQKEVRLIINAKLEEAKDDEPTKESDYQISQELNAALNDLKGGISEFFKFEYDIDVSKKLEKMAIRVFSQKVSGDGFTGGYTEKGKSYININECIFTDYPEYIISSYLHETMHYIGFISENQTMIDDGMAEYMAAKVASFIGITYLPSECYSYYTLIAEQLCAVNEEYLVKAYLTKKDFDVCEHIEETLKNVNQSCLKVDSIGDHLNLMVETLGKDYGNYSYGMAFEAQEIVACYCRQFSPSKEQIEKIRSSYFVEDFEEVKIKEVEGGYIII